MNRNNIIFLILFFVLLITDPISILLSLSVILPFYIFLNNLEESFLFSASFLYLELLIVNILKIPISLYSYIFFSQLLFSFIFAFFKGDLIKKKIKKIRIDHFLIFCFCIIIFLSFFNLYFNFSDSMYHYSMINKIIAENEIINHSPFYGKDFYDVRYSYSFYIPFLSVVSKVLENANIKENIDIVWNSTHIFIYIWSILFLYLFCKRYYGKKTAQISVFVFSFIFICIKSDLYKGFGFSLSNYPQSVMIYVMFYLFLNIIFYKRKKFNFFLCGFLFSGIHLFYAIFYSILEIIYIIKRYLKDRKIELSYIIFYILGMVPVLFLKFFNGLNINNNFFYESDNNIILQNLKYLKNGVPGYFLLLIIPFLFYFFKLFKTKKYFFYLTIAVYLMIFTIPLLKSIMPFNAQKLRRIYQIFPLVLLFSPMISFIYYKSRKKMKYIFLMIFILSFLNPLFHSKQSTLDKTIGIRKMITQLPKNSRILSSPDMNMLISCFSNNYVTGIYREYSAPSVDNVKERENSYNSFILNGSNMFKADYALVLPEHSYIIKKYNNKKYLQGGFWLIDLKK